MNRANNEEIDIGISGLRKLSEVINQQYGFELSNYAGTFLKRRISKIITQNDLKNLDGLLNVLESEPSFFTKFQTQLTVEGTEFFRDPGFWRFMRDEICKSLKNNLLKIKVWLPGCSTGEELLTTAIMLMEAGLYDKSTILATDINQEIISQCRTRVYSNNLLEISENNYKRFKEDESADFLKYCKQQAGGFSFSDDIYRNIEYDIINYKDTKNIKSVNVIICRNHFIYFNAQYQEKLLEEFAQKLTVNGFFAIGNKENISFCSAAKKFSAINESEKIFKKIIN